MITAHPGLDILKLHFRTLVGLPALVLIFFCIVAATPRRIHGQTSKGILAGVIRDSTGAVLPNAEIVITNEDTGETRTVSSSSTGTYRVEAINPGNYRIHVTNAGFAPVDVQHISVLPSVVTTYDASLPIGESTSTVTVEAESNAINTENGQLSGTIGKQELNQVPIFSLNPADLTSEMPGVTRQYVTVQNLGGIGGNGLVKLTVNGARPRANNFMIDSQDINDVSLGGEAIQPIMPDFFSSVTVLLNDPSAEYGRAGGAVINQITQHGTNRFHGSVHEIYTGSGLDAIDGQSRRAKPLLPGQPIPKARYNTHQLGFTLSGPIFKDKLFGFGGATFQRFYGSTQATPVELPNALGYATLKNLAAAGNAQASSFLPYLNNGSYLNPALYTVLSNSAQESLGVSPMPGCPAGCNITTGIFQRNAVPQLNPDTQWIYRVDFTATSRDTFTVRYIHDRNSLSPYFPLNPTSLPGFDSQNFGVSELGGGTWTHVFTPNLLNEFRASETRINAQFAGTADTLANPTAKLYNINFSGTGLGGSGNGTPLNFGVSQNMPQGRKEDLYQFQDTVGYTHGRQSFRIGADIGRLIEIDLVAQNALGLLTYAAGGGLSSIDNFLRNQTGTSGSATRTFGPTRTDPHIWKLAAFIQDDVKLSPDFTVNLGVRYDYLTNPLNSLTYPSININNPSAPITTYIPVHADKNNIAPRLGFAWVPHGGIFSDGKTVIHGGIGIFYDPFFTNILVNSAQASPVAPTGTLTTTAIGGLPNASSLIPAITPAFGPTTLVQSAVNTLVNPLTYQYNFGVERALPFQIKGAVNYVGSRGEKLYTSRRLNYFVNGNRVYTKSLGDINVRDNRGDSQYHALQVQLDRAFSRGLFFRFAYTYSKLLDDASEVFDTFAGNRYSANLAGDALHQEWGASAFDRRNNVVITYSWSPAGFRSQNTAANLLLGAFTRNFTISGQTQLYSGLYTNFNTGGRDINGDGRTDNDRPVLSNPHAPITLVGIDGSYIGGANGVYYDQAIYNASPATARVRKIVNASDVHFLVPNATNGFAMMSQEVSRNSYANAGQQYWNVALEKAIHTPFTHLEGSGFLFRAEAQQLGNHNNVTYFTNNVTQVGLPGFQNVSNAREANFQHFRLWAKFQF